MLIYQAVVTALLAALLLNTLNNLRLIRRLRPGRIPHPGRWYRSWYRRVTRHGPSRAA